MKQFSILFFIVCYMITIAEGQSLVSYGFKTGLNFSTISGDSETDASGNELETFNYSNGFQIGAIVKFRLTDLLGIQTELLYNQKGYEYNYNGASFLSLPTESGDRFTAIGTQNTRANVKNSYFDIPIMGYARLGRLQLAAGVNIGLLLSSNATGTESWTELTTVRGDALEDITFNIDNNYFKDGLETVNFADNQTIVVRGTEVILPAFLTTHIKNETATEAVDLFNRLDFGLNGEIDLFLNKGLFIGVRANYGLSDITKTEADFSNFERNPNNTLINRADDDRNLSIQTSIGFSF